MNTGLNASMLIEKIKIIADDVACEEFLSRLETESREKVIRLAFVNAHAFNMASRDDAFLKDILSCDYVVRDGIGMKILYRMLGQNAGLNMNGTDIIPRLLEIYKGRDIALMGTQSPYLDNAARQIILDGLSPVHIVNGFQKPGHYSSCLIERPVPLVILGMGMPKQEHVAGLISSELKTPALIVCGGAILDFIGGKVTRAPEIIRRFGLEWAYRLMLEPQRLFKRYVVGNIEFLVRAIKLSLHSKNENKLIDKNKPLRVLHVVRQFSPAIGGLESYVMSMAQHQKKLGYDCTVLTLDKVFHGEVGFLPTEEQVNGINVKRVSFFGKRRFFIPLVSPAYFSGFDIVHVHNTDVFYDYAAVVSPFTKACFFATTHGGFFHTKDFSALKKIYFNTITRFSSLFYKAIFAISGNDLNTFSGLNKNVILLHNAVEPLTTEISDGHDFLYIGRLAEHKRVDLVVETFAALVKDHGISGTLHIVGPSWDVTIEDLQKKAASLEISDHVIFHGAASPDNMRDIALQSGYYLSASSYEGFGMSMLEGMSAGLIPFVQPNEAFSELVGASNVGLTVDYQNPASAAKSIAEKIPEITPADKLAAQSFSAKFSWQELVAKTDAYYRGIAP